MGENLIPVISDVTNEESAQQRHLNQKHKKGFQSNGDKQPTSFFFTPMPCSYTSLPLDGMARNYYYYFLNT